NKSFNRNPANHKLYHALMEALIEDENAIDKGVADTIKDHKRKYDDDYDDDDDDDEEDPPAGPYQGSKTGKSASAKEPDEEPIVKVLMDHAVNTVGYPCHLIVAADYFFNNDLEYQKSFDPEKTNTASITKTKAARYEIVDIEDMVLILWNTIKHAYDKDAAKGIKH
ncbi:hypothetical protein Tco_1522154, partial [Tanacetum coccineum]